MTPIDAAPPADAVPRPILISVGTRPEIMLVDCHTHSPGVRRRRRLGHGKGVSAQAERYRKASHRLTRVIGGGFVQW